MCFTIGFDGRIWVAVNRQVWEGDVGIVFFFMQNGFTDEGH